MLANYIKTEDRDRLSYINQALMGTLTPDERSVLDKERLELLNKTKTVQECDLNELMELKSQLFEQYQKHAAIGSQHVILIGNNIRSLEILIYEKEREQKLLDTEDVVETNDTTKASTSSVSPKQDSYSWTVTPRSRAK